MNTVKAIQEALAQANRDQLLAENALDERIRELPEHREWKKAILRQRVLRTEMEQALKERWGKTK